MARKLSFVEKAKPGQVSVADIPQEIKDEIDAAYDHMRTHPDLEGYAAFTQEDGEPEPKKQLATWLRQARAYCGSREAGILKFRLLPSKTLPDGEARYQLTADVPANGAAAGK